MKKDKKKQPHQEQDPVLISLTFFSNAAISIDDSNAVEDNDNSAVAQDYSNASDNPSNSAVSQDMSNASRDPNDSVFDQKVKPETDKK